VPTKIGRRWILLGLALCLEGIPIWAGDLGPPRVSLTVAVHNHAGVPRSTVDEAERTASSIFKQAGVDVDWANCDLPAEVEQLASSCRVTEFPTHLQLSIVRRSKNLHESVLGVSFLEEDGSGCYSDVFFEPLEELHERFNVNLGPLLGDVVAHEIAHLLLGTNAHSDTGIMRPHWSEQDFVNVNKGHLLFTQAQGQTMRKKVSLSLCRNDRGSVVARVARD
jgi:hypothetical protein